MSYRDDEHPWTGYDGRVVARMHAQLLARGRSEQDTMHTERWKKIRRRVRRLAYYDRLGTECSFDATLWSCVGMDVSIDARPKKTGFMRIDR